MIAILIIVGVLVILLIGLYNRFVKMKNNVENSFADIDVQLKARFDLVGNLVNTVKWYAAHEKDLFESVTQARTNYNNAKGDDEKVAADNMLTGTLKTLFAVAENYPQLKADQNFMQLQTELSDLENKIAAARRYYNSSVKEYDNALEAFPGNIVAGIFNFKKAKDYFATEEAQKNAPVVDFTKK